LNSSKGRGSDFFTINSDEDLVELKFG